VFIIYHQRIRDNLKIICDFIEIKQFNL
jgi:hypothetical protein